MPTLIHDLEIGHYDNYTDVTCVFEIDRDNVHRDSITLEKLVMKLLKEGVDPAPNNANKYKKYAVNLASVDLGFSERIRRSNQSVWKVTPDGRKIGCANYAQGIIFSQRAYEEIKNYFLNLK